MTDRSTTLGAKISAISQLCSGVNMCHIVFAGPSLTLGVAFTCLYNNDAEKRASSTQFHNVDFDAKKIMVLWDFYEMIPKKYLKTWKEICLDSWVDTIEVLHSRFVGTSGPPSGLPSGLSFFQKFLFGCQNFEHADSRMQVRYLRFYYHHLLCDQVIRQPYSLTCRHCWVSLDEPHYIFLPLGSDPVKYQSQENRNVYRSC